MSMWRVAVQAETAEQARAATAVQHGRPGVHWVRDTFDEVVRRLEERPAYSVAALWRLVDEGAITQAIVEGLELLDDVRLHDQEKACAIWVDGDRWIVFSCVRDND